VKGDTDQLSTSTNNKYAEMTALSSFFCVGCVTLPDHGHVTQQSRSIHPVDRTCFVRQR